MGTCFLTMKKIYTIYTFSACDENDNVVSNLDVGNEVKFNPRPMNKRICFIWERKEECFDLIFYKRDEIKLFQLRENKYFEKDYLKHLGNEFSFDIVSDPIHPEYLRGTLSKISDIYSLPLMGVVKKTEDHYFLMIFAERGNTDFENNIIYVHGIWKVELQKAIKKLFLVSFDQHRRWCIKKYIKKRDGYCPYYPLLCSCTAAQLAQQY